VSATAEAVLDLARADLGYVESPRGSNRTKFGRWYGMDGVAWCAMAVSYWFYHAGLPLPATTKKGFSYTPAGAAWFMDNDRWLRNTSSKVLPGDVVFFYWPNMRRIAHVGIVERLAEDGSVVTIEGNTDAAGGRTGGQVMRRVRSRATVHANGGFGRPDFVEPMQEENDMAGPYFEAKIGGRVRVLTPADEDGSVFACKRGEAGTKQKKALIAAGATIHKLGTPEASKLSKNYPLKRGT
jgi:hypothetical protein